MNNLNFELMAWSFCFSIFNTLSTLFFIKGITTHNPSILIPSALSDAFAIGALSATIYTAITKRSLLS